MLNQLSLRARIYEPLKDLKESLAHIISHLKSYRNNYYAQIASNLIKRVGLTLNRILTYSCDDQVLMLYLTQIVRWLNMVLVRASEMEPRIAMLAEDLYQRFISLFPSDTSIQLELFDFGEFASYPFPSEPIFPGVKKFVDYWMTTFPGQKVGRWFAALMKGHRFRSTQRKQLELDLTLENRDWQLSCVRVR